MPKKIKGDNHRQKEKPLSHYRNTDNSTPAVSVLLGGNGTVDTMRPLEKYLSYLDTHTQTHPQWN